MLGLLSCALNRVIIELCQEKSSNHEKHGWNFYAKVVFLQPLLYKELQIGSQKEQIEHYCVRKNVKNYIKLDE